VATCATIEDMAAAEKIILSYISRLMRLAYLSPNIVKSTPSTPGRCHSLRRHKTVQTQLVSLLLETIFQSFIQ